VVYMPVILAAQEVEVGGLPSKVGLGKSTDPIWKIKVKRDGEVIEVMECWHSKHNILNSNPLLPPKSIFLAIAQILCSMLPQAIIIGLFSSCILSYILHSVVFFHVFPLEALKIFLVASWNGLRIFLTYQVAGNIKHWPYVAINLICVKV
jgi:hypothetical protein